MMEVLDILLPMGILIMCVYLIGYMSGCEQTREVYDPVMRKKDLERIPEQGLRVVLLELVDRLDLKSNIVRCIGSSPIDYTREVKYRKGGPILRPLPKKEREL